MSSKNGEERLPEDLQHVADMLHEQRPELEPLELDRIKLRAMSTAPAGRGFGMRSRLTGVLTAAFLIVGTGGALAICGAPSFGHGGNGKNGNGNAGYEELKNCGPKSYKKCPKPPPPPPKCKPGYELGAEGCIPIPPPPPVCKKGYEWSVNKCIVIPPPPPPPPTCKTGYQYSGGKCIVIPPPPKVTPPPCIKTVIIHNKVVIKGQKGCGTIYYP